MGKKKSEWHILTDVDEVARTAMCSKCGSVKIGRGTNGSGNPNWRCRTLLNARSRIDKYRRKYGIDIQTTEIKDCELCGGTTRVAYDHSHKTGKFRGWLCMKCNTALGLVNDDVELLKKMIAYLEVI